jgi:hypothetical protein
MAPCNQKAHTEIRSRASKSKIQAQDCKLNAEVVLAFVGLKAAFDSVSHKLIDEALGEAGASGKARALLRALLSTAKGRVRASNDNGKRSSTEWFRIERGVVQGDMVPPLCSTIALAHAMGKVDPGGGSDALGWLIEMLACADDFVLIDGDASSATGRITAIAKGLREIADMGVSGEKTECMFVGHQDKIRTDDLFELEDKGALDRVLKFKCEACGRRFSTHQGLKTHENRCGSTGRLDPEQCAVNKISTLFLCML